MRDRGKVETRAGAGGQQAANKLLKRNWSGINSLHYWTYDTWQSWLCRTLRPALLTSSTMYLFLIFKCSFPSRSFSQAHKHELPSSPFPIYPIYSLTCTVPYTGNAMKNKQTTPDLTKCTSWWRKNNLNKAYLICATTCSSIGKCSCSRMPRMKLFQPSEEILV